MKQSAVATTPPISPFVISIDTREQLPYAFLDIPSDSRNHNTPIQVRTIRATLHTGDYSIFGLPGVALERKSKEDLFGSVGRRKNFIGRLERMAELDYAAVIVEAELFDCLGNPPGFSRLHPRSLSRTLIAWRQRYRVDWYFVPGRSAAERTTYRILERFWLDRREIHEAVNNTSTNESLKS